MACTVQFAPESKDETHLEKLVTAFEREKTQLRLWCDLGREKGKRTAVVRFGHDAAFSLLSAYVLTGDTRDPETGLPFAVALRLAAQDLKAFYFEAAAARPGESPPTSAVFKRWFWEDTAAGFVLRAIKEKCLKEADKSLRMTGDLLLAPLEQV